VFSPELSQLVPVAQRGWIGEQPLDLGSPGERVSESIAK